MKRITAWAAVLTLTLSLLTGCAQIDESSADELPFPSEETPVEEEHSGLPAVFALPYLEGQPLNPSPVPTAFSRRWPPFSMRDCSGWIRPSHPSRCCARPTPTIRKR